MDRSTLLYLLVSDSKKTISEMYSELIRLFYIGLCFAVAATRTDFQQMYLSCVDSMSEHSKGKTQVKML